MEKGYQTRWQILAQTAGKKPVAVRGIRCMSDTLHCLDVVALSPFCHPKSFLCIPRSNLEMGLWPYRYLVFHQSQYFLLVSRAQLEIWGYFSNFCMPSWRVLHASYLRQNSAAGLGVNKIWMCLHKPVSPTTIWHTNDKEVFNHYFWLLSLL